MDKTISIYTDASFLFDRHKGLVILVSLVRTEEKKAYYYSVIDKCRDNNQAELLSVEMWLKFFSRKFPDYKLDLKTDSQFAVDHHSKNENHSVSHVHRLKNMANFYVHVITQHLRNRKKFEIGMVEEVVIL